MGADTQPQVNRSNAMNVYDVLVVACGGLLGYLVGAALVALIRR